MAEFEAISAFKRQLRNFVIETRRCRAANCNSAGEEGIGGGGAGDFHELQVVVLGGVNVGKQAAFQDLAQMGHFSADGTYGFVA